MDTYSYMELIQNLNLNLIKSYAQYWEVRTTSEDKTFVYITDVYMMAYKSAYKHN